MLIAYATKDQGGAYECMKKAQQKGIKVTGNKNAKIVEESVFIWYNSFKRIIKQMEKER